MGTTDFLVVYIVFIDHVMYVLAENRAWKGMVGMGSIDFLVSYIVSIDHVMYVLAENKAWRGVVGHWSTPHLIHCTILMTHKIANLCNCQANNVVASCTNRLRHVILYLDWWSTCPLDLMARCWPLLLTPGPLKICNFSHPRQWWSSWLTMLAITFDPWISGATMSIGKCTARVCTANHNSTFGKLRQMVCENGKWKSCKSSATYEIGSQDVGWWGFLSSTRTLSQKTWNIFELIHCPNCPTKLGQLPWIFYWLNVIFLDDLLGKWSQLPQFFIHYAISLNILLKQLRPSFSNFHPFCNFVDVGCLSHN